MLEFTRVMGQHDTFGGKSYRVPDNMKLPIIDKPKWMGEIEKGLRCSSPPMVGKQATRLEGRLCLL